MAHLCVKEGEAAKHGEAAVHGNVVQQRRRRQEELAYAGGEHHTKANAQGACHREVGITAGGGSDKRNGAHNGCSADESALDDGPTQSGDREERQALVHVAKEGLEHDRYSHSPFLFH